MYGNHDPTRKAQSNKRGAIQIKGDFIKIKKANKKKKTPSIQTIHQGVDEGTSCMTGTSPNQTKRLEDSQYQYSPESIATKRKFLIDLDSMPGMSK